MTTLFLVRDDSSLDCPDWCTADRRDYTSSSWELGEAILHERQILRSLAATLQRAADELET